MADNKGKTKAAMLQELESIKGLLRDDDDIPILQEVIAPAEKPHQAPLARHNLDELQVQFQELSQAIAGGKTEESIYSEAVASKPLESRITEKAADTSASLMDAFTRASQHQPKSAISNQQASLFQEKESQYEEASSTQRYPDSAADHPDADNRIQRPPLARASGENPFLPQHIRARLHGNNPPPLFDFSPGKNLPGSKSANETKTGHSEFKTESKPDNTLRQHVIQEVIASVMPQLEKELRRRLEELSEQELEQMHERN